jgi:glutathione reductase (NADPH)
MVCSAQVRKFANEQYAATGLTMHANHTPVEVRKQEDGKLTIVVQDKEGNKTEITDNDQVQWASTTLARCL